jgi:hypothetical protein
MAIIRQQTRVFNKPIGVVRADAGGARVGEAIAGAADTMARIAFQDAAREAEKRGIELAKSVDQSQLTTINPETGKPEAFNVPEGFGQIAADSYQRVVDARFEDAVDMQLRVKAQEISLKYQYNADAYADVFKDYIADLSKNAGGQYGAFIESTGAKYLALTSLNIKERAMAKARADLADSTISSFENKKSQAYDLARTGKYLITDPEGEASEVSDFASKSVDVITKAVDSNLLKKGADRVKNIEISTEIAKGAIEHINGLTINGRPLSSSERNLVTLAVRTGNANIEGLPKALQANIEAMLEYVSPENMNAVLGHQDSVASDYNAIEADQITQAKATAKADGLMFEISADQTIDNLAASTMGSVYAAFGDDDTNINRYTAIPGAVANSSAQFDSLNQTLLSNVGNNYSPEKYKSDIKDAKESLLRPYLLSAAAMGNSEDLRLALANPTADALSKLNDKQRQLVVELNNSSFFELDSDTFEFVNSTLRGVRDQEGEVKDQISQNINIMDGFNIALEAASSGSLLEEDYTKLAASLRSNIKPNGFTLSQVDGFLSKLDKARASGFITEFASVYPRMNSQTLNQLQQFVQLKGQGAAENFPAGVQQFGKYILDAVSNPEDLKSVSNEINALEATYAAREEDERKARELAQEVSRMSMGQGNMLDVKDRKSMDAMLDKMGIDLSEFVTMSPKEQELALSFNRATAGEKSLIDPLSRLAAGLNVNNPESYIQMYARLSNDFAPGSSSDVVIDRFGSGPGAPLSNVQKERLNDILSIYSVEGGNINEIALRIAENQREGKVAKEAFFTKSNEYSNVGEYLSTLKSIGNNPTVIKEMIPVAEYLIGNGLDADEVHKRIDQLIDRNYEDSEHIIDPMSPSPMLNKSRFALTKTITDPDARQAFITKINSDLSNVSIDGRKFYLGAVKVSPTGFRTKVSKENRLYLRPDPTGATDRYYVYYVDNNELKPLIYSADSKGNQVSKGGQNYFASFSIEKEVGDIIRDNKTKRVLENMSDAERMEFVRQMQIDLKDIPIEDRMKYIQEQRLRFESQQEGSM